MSDYTNLFLSILVLMIFLTISGNILFERKVKLYNISTIMKIVFYTLLLASNYYLDIYIIKTVNVVLILSIFYNRMFNLSIVKAFINSIALFFVVQFLNLSMALFDSLIMKIAVTNEVLDVKNSIIDNALIGLFLWHLCHYLKEEITAIYDAISGNIKNCLAILLSFFLIIGMILLLEIRTNDVNLDINLFLDMTVILFLLLVMAMIFYLESKNNLIANDYNKANLYMEESKKLITRYSEFQHRTKNNLVAIKGYVIDNNQASLKYIDELLGMKSDFTGDWISNLNNIYYDGMRYLIFSKLKEGEKQDLKMTVNVSKELTKYNSTYLKIKDRARINIILGELFDNAIYEAKLSKTKELHFEIFLDDLGVVIQISNSYTGKKNLKKISSYGYSTKGSRRGIGLYDIDKIVSSTKYLSIERMIIDNYFITLLYLRKGNVKN